MARQPQKIAKESAKSIRERILKGLKPPLKESTMRIRKMTISKGANKRGPVAGATPLLATGALYRSIKDTKQGLKMLEYGLHHHKGFTPDKIPFTQTLKKDVVRFVDNKKAISVPARPFIFPGAKDAFNITKTLIKDMNRALKSGGAQRP
jgi:hypothetical protein